MKRKRLLTDKYYKAQNQFSEAVKNKAIALVKEWLIEFEISGYYSGLLARHLISEAICQQIGETADSAPEVFLSDESKINLLVSRAKKIAYQLDETSDLEPLLGELAERDAKQDGNSL